MTEKEAKIITNLTRIVQRLEHSGAELTVREIELVKEAKNFLGYSTPKSIEEGTGVMVAEY